MSVDTVRKALVKLIHKEGGRVVELAGRYHKLCERFCMHPAQLCHQPIIAGEVNVETPFGSVTFCAVELVCDSPTDALPRCRVMLEWRPQPVVALWLGGYGFDLCLLRDEMNYSVAVLKAVYDCLTLLRQSLETRIKFRPDHEGTAIFL